MAKNNNRLKFRLIHLILTLLFLFGSGVAAWVWLQAETKAIAKETVTIKAEADILSTEGCKPANKNKFDIALVQKDITTMKDDISEMKTEQRQGFRAILKRLPE